MTDPHASGEQTFVARFKKRLRDLLGEDYDDGYATDSAHRWWHDSEPWPEGTPEGCAEVEASENGPE